MEDGKRKQNVAPISKNFSVVVMIIFE